MLHLAVVRSAPDPAQLSVSRSQGRVFEQGKRLTDPRDEAAVEAALQARGPDDQVVVLLVGEEADTDALRKPLAMGADRAILLAASGDGFVRANLISALARKLGAGAVWFAPDAEEGRRLPKISRLAPPDLKPRQANALAIMKAAKKPVERLEAAALGLPEDDLKPRLVLRSSNLVEEP